jgi:hypothetical protein
VAPPAAEEYSEKLVQLAAYWPPLPVQPANSAKARAPAVSRSVTRSPAGLWSVQCAPPSVVAHSDGPYAQP